MAQLYTLGDHASFANGVADTAERQAQSLAALAELIDGLREEFACFDDLDQIRDFYGRSVYDDRRTLAGVMDSAEVPDEWKIRRRLVSDWEK